MNTDPNGLESTKDTKGHEERRRKTKKNEEIIRKPGRQEMRRALFVSSQVSWLPDRFLSLSFVPLRVLRGFQSPSSVFIRVHLWFHFVHSSASIWRISSGDSGRPSETEALTSSSSIVA